jgi:hypothetical protein
VRAEGHADLGGQKNGCGSVYAEPDVARPLPGTLGGGPVSVGSEAGMDPRGKQPQQGGQAIPIDPTDPNLPPKVRDVLHKGRTSWLKNPEVCDLLVNHAAFNMPISRDAPMQPPGARGLRSLHYLL